MSSLGSQIGVSTSPPLPPPPPSQQHPHPPHNVSPGPPRTLRRLNPKATGTGKIFTASTPNLSGLYSAHSKLATPHSLQRKASHATLTPSSLAAIPDATESYALASLNGSPSRREDMPITPRSGAPAAAGDDVTLGDVVDVPGNMYGTVRFIGMVQGKKGTFAGVELHPEFASRGKNSGDVDGVSYFGTRIPGAGIFLPLQKAIRREAHTPATTPHPTNGLKAGNQNSTNHTPPTPSLPQFSRSVGPGRASSPLGKLKSRPSISRPESPVRKLQLTSAARPTIATPSGNLPRYGSPTHGRFSKSLHGTGTPEPGKRGMLQPNRKLSMGQRSTSALSALSGQHSGFTTDEETLPVGDGRVSPIKFRTPSRQVTTPQDEEIERLRAELEDRDRHLQEQAANLAEMESSLAELQTMMDEAEMQPPAPARRSSLDDKDSAHLRALVKEKNEKIAMLTAEFDAHRADFRSTIDTLELASSETERVYEKRIEELMQDLQQIQERESDVDVVATQLKQLEELVQELEEGLEDARRGEAEARGEVEFLRGEVERTRTELRREREKAAGAANGTNGAANGDHSALFKELEEKEDEIRGLKAIIHSLSRDSVPGDVDGSHLQRTESHNSQISANNRIATEKLERQVAELRLDSDSNKEEEVEHGIDALRRGSAATLRGSSTSLASRFSSHEPRDIVAPGRISEQGSPKQKHQPRKSHNRMDTLDTMPESDTVSSFTENSTLWCELCETSGHDILTCTNMFGNQSQAARPASTNSLYEDDEVSTPMPLNDDGHAPPNPLKDDQYNIAPLAPRAPSPPDEPVEAAEPPVATDKVKVLPNLNDPGPVAGKESGIIDPDAWCALCEKDGHNSVDCPFDDEF